LRISKIGERVIWFTAYNPADPISMAYCAYAVERARAALADVDENEVHRWVRAKYPDLAPLLDAVERGDEIPRDAQAGEFPLTPGQERFELPIVAHLLRKTREETE
jgi:hypothetical protein